MRQDNWQLEINDLAVKMQNTEFAWGSWDCGFLASEIVKAVTGKEDSYDKMFRDKYSTAIGSARILKKNGFKNLHGYIESILGEPIKPSHAWRGDIAFYEGCCGLCLGQYSLFIGTYDIMAAVTTGRAIDSVPDELPCCIKIPRNDIHEYFKVR